MVEPAGASRTIPGKSSAWSTLTSMMFPVGSGNARHPAPALVPAVAPAPPVPPSAPAAAAPPSAPLRPLLSVLPDEPPVAFPPPPTLPPRPAALPRPLAPAGPAVVPALPDEPPPRPASPPEPEARPPDPAEPSPPLSPQPSRATAIHQPRSRRTRIRVRVTRPSLVELHPSLAPWCAPVHGRVAVSRSCRDRRPAALSQALHQEIA